jgi:hypothetical protein
MQISIPIAAESSRRIKNKGIDFFTTTSGWLRQDPFKYFNFFLAL